MGEYMDVAPPLSLVIGEALGRITTRRDQILGDMFFRIPYNSTLVVDFHLATACGSCQVSG